MNSITLLLLILRQVYRPSTSTLSIIPEAYWLVAGDVRGADDAEEVGPSGRTVKRIVPTRLMSLTFQPMWISTLYLPGFQPPWGAYSFT